MEITNLYKQSLAEPLKPETKEERLKRQLKDHKQWLYELKLDCQAMLIRKVQRDSYYKRHDFKEEVLLIA